MRCLACEVAYPVINFNGTLLEFIEGLHPSGNTLTVYLNCKKNIKNLYCYVKQVYPTVTVRDILALSTYGDDFIATVHAKYPLINIKLFAAWLANRGETLTMPDKSSELVEYMQEADVDYLKRKSNYVPELDCTVGALDEMSIFKSLHCIRENKDLKPTHISIQNIEGGLREWFLHGREIYEIRRSQMQEVLLKTGLASNEVHWTFDDRVTKWLETYRSENTPLPEITESLTRGIGMTEALENDLLQQPEGDRPNPAYDT